MILGFTKSKDNPNIYFKIVDDGPIILLLYVDDLFLTREEKLITNCKKKLAAEFEMKDLGLMHYFLGLEICKAKRRSSLTKGSMQLKY